MNLNSISYQFSNQAQNKTYNVLKDFWFLGKYRKAGERISLPKEQASGLLYKRIIKLVEIKPAGISKNMVKG
ncbi:hypothetical protein ABSA28_01183 [Candidatus Hepatincolaceae symbiont of Richtersius coronifer]